MTSSLVAVVFASQLFMAEPPAATPAEDAAARSAAAAEKAAEAAQKAADAAVMAAEAAKAIAEKLAPAPAAKPEEKQEEAKPEEKKGPTWTGAVTVGLVSLTGNSQSIAVNGAAAVERKAETWIIGLKAGGSYGEAMSSGDPKVWSVNSLNANFQARVALRFTPRYSAYVVGGIDTDHLNSIEERPYGELGVGILWLDEMQGDLSKLKLGTDIGFRLGQEYRYQYYPVGLNLGNVTIAAPRIGVSFRYALNKHVIFTEDAEVMANVLGEVRWLVNSATKIAARVVNPLSITVSLLIKYDSAPAAGKVDTDTALSFGIEAGF